jgi:hypothetical protein
VAGVDEGAVSNCGLSKRPVWERTRAATFSGLTATTTSPPACRLGAAIDHSSSGLDDVEVVLDGDHCVPGVMLVTTPGMK